MAYIISYVSDYNRVISALVIDAKDSVGVEYGSAWKIFTSTQALLDSFSLNSIFYKIESVSGNLVGYFCLLVDPSNKTASLKHSIIRPSYRGNQLAISQLITNFIIEKKWINDFLFDY